MTVFCHALKFFKDHALQEISDQSDVRITNSDVKWVITVPAIWKAPAKQFMRQAAYIVRSRRYNFPHSKQNVVRRLFVTGWHRFGEQSRPAVGRTRTVSRLHLRATPAHAPARSGEASESSADAAQGCRRD